RAAAQGREGAAREVATAVTWSKSRDRSRPARARRMRIRLAALLALTSVASADPLPCGDAPSPKRPAVAPDPAGIDRIAIAQTSDGALVITLASHGVYKLPTPAVAHATWAFVEHGGRFATVGVIAKDESVASPGRGTIAVGRTACTPGGH